MMHTNRTTEQSDDAGFGLVELIVAMTIIALVLMALAPFLISSFQATARNVRISGATELVNQRIDLAQSPAHTSSCASFDTFLKEHANPNKSVNKVVDPRRSIRYQITMAHDFKLSACNTAVTNDKAKSYFVTTVVKDQNSDAVLAQAKTWIAVPGFGS